MMGVRGWFVSAAAAAVGVAALTGCGRGPLDSGGGTGSAGTTGSAGNPGMGGASEGGSPAAAGTGGSATPSDAFHDPVCPDSVSNGQSCAPGDPQFCYKGCGPDKVGRKSATCVPDGNWSDAPVFYREMSGCAFDSSRDYSCYKISTAANSMCPAGVTPMASRACDVPPCVVCNDLQGLAGGLYSDSTGAAKIGFCVCQAAPSADGTHVWSCATDNGSWPCPLGNGC